VEIAPPTLVPTNLFPKAPNKVLGATVAFLTAPCLALPNAYKFDIEGVALYY